MRDTLGPAVPKRRLKSHAAGDPLVVGSTAAAATATSATASAAAAAAAAGCTAGETTCGAFQPIPPGQVSEEKLPCDSEGFQPIPPGQVSEEKLPCDSEVERTEATRNSHIAIWECTQPIPFSSLVRLAGVEPAVRDAHIANQNTECRYTGVGIETYPIATATAAAAAAAAASCTAGETTCGGLQPTPPGQVSEEKLPCDSEGFQPIQPGQVSGENCPAIARWGVQT